MIHSHEDTIAALSTPAGESGIAVIRMSGADALRILTGLFRTPGGSVRAAQWEHRRLYHGFLCANSGETLDEAVCAIMRAPESYTGEDTVEISCHGSTLAVSSILEALGAAGARGANPGEFTERAFLNGKLDLIQAEAVADLIHARSELQRAVAQEQLAGSLSLRIQALADGMLSLLGLVEANIDFIEEDIDLIDYAQAEKTVEEQVSELDALLGSARFTRPFREGYRAAIAGGVNAGKSSIFNRLIGEERAIVTKVPGTTRDVLREPVVLGGLLFLLQDTAGLRGTDDHVERMGVERAEAAAADADILLFVVDGSAPLMEETRSRIADLDPGRTMIVLNKIDLPPAVSLAQLAALRPDLSAIPASAKAGEGMTEIERALVSRAGKDGLDWIARERVALNARLATLLGHARERLLALQAGIENRAPLEILAQDAREILIRYEEATGKRYTEELLDTIFSRFCIGK